ncbi:hypothetical protein OEA41_010706 [Lepraria neglecta]|uniref:Uncharacterized protein n=1 Tax=Lepraria neglecta TaxID=209136 RepID=A0AAD9YWW1_9LECA|nr:hypothetical protein OEA41_010706 [Lepraria neglecta]
MGLTKKKFSLSSLRLKPASPVIELGADYDVDTSPPYSPTESEMERPLLNSSLISDLREACAIIVNETNPPDPDEEPEHGEILRRKFEEQKKAKHVAQIRATEVKARVEVKAPKSIPRSEPRLSEKEQKAAARKAEDEARRLMVRGAEPERRKVAAQQAEIRMGKSAVLRKEDPQKDPSGKMQLRRYSARRPTEEVPLFGPKPEAQTYVPKQGHLPANFDLLAGKRRPSDTYSPKMEPIEPTHTKMSSKALGKRKEVDSASSRSPSQARSATAIEYLPPVHATIVQNSRSRPKDADHPAFRANRDTENVRPESSSATRLDYSEQSGGSSKSTTRSNTEYDNHGRPTSTAMTSAIITPGEDKRLEYMRRPSDKSSSQEEELTPQAKAWEAHKVALRIAEEKYQKSGRAARNSSRASKRSRRARLDSDTEDDRPLSRAGSIAGSITSSINNYLRPRASQDSMRSGRSSASGPSRSESRSSSMSRRSGNGWWKGAGLRRRGSWSSFRSARPEGDQPNKLRKNGEPNLNRPLPALPGLDQYRETKPHIGQLMKAGARGRKKEKTPRPDASYPAPYQPQQQTGHVKKESISAPILRNSSMERTLHRYRDSQIQSSASQTRLRDESNKSPEKLNQQQRKDSDTSKTSLKVSKPRTSNPGSRSQSRQQQNQDSSFPRRARGDSNASATSRSKDSKSQKPPPPMIRGPSYHREVEAGVYPRPMEVSKGTNAMHLAGNGSVTKLPREGRQPPTKGFKGMFGKRRGVAVN